jgi:hypothetical protein
LGTFALLWWMPAAPRSKPPPDHIQLEYITLPRQAKKTPEKPAPKARPRVAGSPQEKRKAGSRKPTRPERRREKKIAERPDPAEPPDSVVRRKRPSLDEMIRSQAWVPPPPVRTLTNRDATFVQHPDGSVTLRSRALARAILGARVDNRFTVHDGRIRDGSDTAEAIGKRLASQLPRLGARSPQGVDLGRMNWYASRLASTCSIYAEDRNAAAPSGVYIVIDSSGSMQQDFYTSPATTCGYSVAVSALQANEDTRVGVINFSWMNHFVGETRDLGRIADGITRAVGGETYLPGKSIRKYVDGGGRKDIVVITDSHIRNYEQSLPHFKDVLARDPRNQGILIVIGDERFTNSAAIRRFIWAGFKIRHHTRFKSKLDEHPDRRPRPRPFRFTM